MVAPVAVVGLTCAVRHTVALARPTLVGTSSGVGGTETRRATSRAICTLAVARICVLTCSAATASTGVSPASLVRTANSASLYANSLLPPITR